jgi:hypothetical protein
MVAAGRSATWLAGSIRIAAWDAHAQIRVGSIAEGRPHIRAVSLSGSVVLVAALLEGLWRWKNWICGPATVLLLNGIGQLLFSEALWLFYDRYYLPILPSTTALLTIYLKPTKRVTALIFVGGLFSGAIAVTGTIDMFRFSVAVAEARAWLVRQGVAAGYIDAGYVLNGWWLYAPALPSGLGAEPDVPFVTTMTSLPYKIANSIDPNYVVVRRITWPALWAATDTLYILEHTALTQRWGLPHLSPQKEWQPLLLEK